MSGYTLHAEAFNDIDEVRAYIAEDDPDAADRVVTAIFDRIRSLVGFPYQGYPAPISRHALCGLPWCTNTSQPMRQKQGRCAFWRCSTAAAARASWPRS